MLLLFPWTLSKCSIKPLALGFFEYLERNGHTDIDRSSFLVAQYDVPFKPYDRYVRGRKQNCFGWFRLGHWK